MDLAPQPVGLYLKRQGRFRHLDDEGIARVQSEVDARWELLERRVKYGT
jgi:pyruvate/2-oxoacid:ferredoxin oxidoreductase beta subunit